MTQASEKDERGFATLLREVVEHFERGRRRTRVLSLISIIVSLLLILGYSVQILYPFLFGERFVTVDLLNPSNIAVQSVLIVVVLLWLYLAVGNFLFTRRWADSVRKLKEEEARLLQAVEG